MAGVKLDENMPDGVAAILRDAGHDVSLARDQQLAGAPDEQVLAVAASEGRVLITLDRDFTNILRHPPGLAAGIVVFRLQSQTLPLIRQLAAALAIHLNLESPGRTRIPAAARMALGAYGDSLGTGNLTTRRAQ